MVDVGPTGRIKVLDSKIGPIAFTRMLHSYRAGLGLADSSGFMLRARIQFHANAAQLNMGAAEGLPQIC